MFIDDKCKISDMISLSKKEFLESYRYLTEEEYNQTKKEILKSLEFPKHSEEEYNQIIGELKQDDYKLYKYLTG